MNQKPQIYFGATDRQMEFFLDNKEFSRLFVHGVLFHGDLVIPDIFLYISNLLRNFANNPQGQRFIKSCIRNGSIIPAFRNDTQGSFRDNLNEVKQQQIQGVHSDARKISDILQDAIKGKRLHYLLWPNSPFSVGYKKTLERALLTESIPSGSIHMEHFWEQTREIRFVVIEGAGVGSLGGVRRGDIYNSLASYLQPGNHVIHDIRVILEKLGNKQLASIVQRLLKWVNYCYHFNHGRMFSLYPSLASLDNLDFEFARYLAQIEAGESKSPILKQEFQFPSADALLTIDPSYLFEVRDSDIGWNYFSALTEWQKNPDENNAQVLLDSLDIYTSSIKSLYLERGQHVLNWSGFLRAHIPTGRSRWADIGVEAVKKITGISYLSLVGKVAVAVYESLPDSLEYKIGKPIGIGKRILIEVEEKITSVQER